MILNKLREALSEASEQRRALDEVEADIRRMIAKLSGAQIQQTNDPVVQTSRSVNSDRDQIDEIVDIIIANGSPMHITAIADALYLKTGRTVHRTKLEPGLNRHVRKTKNPRLVKTAPSTFGLPGSEARTVTPRAHIA